MAWQHPEDGVLLLSLIARCVLQQTAIACDACTHTVSGRCQESYPEARRLVDAGEMIPDQMVGDLLLEALLLDEPGLQDDLGFVVDGFPRTSTQERGGRADPDLYLQFFMCICMLVFCML